MERSNPKSWVVTLTPHRSLSPQGFVAVMTLIAGVNFAAGLYFWAVGAWPVVGFCGLDVFIMWWAFRANFAAGNRLERIEITEHDLVLDRRNPSGSEQLRFVRRWVRVELDGDRDRELIGGLFLRSHGQRTEIGSFLAPSEKVSLARELKSALYGRAL